MRPSPARSAAGCKTFLSSLDYAIEKAEFQLGYRPRYNFLEYALGL